MILISNYTHLNLGNMITHPYHTFSGGLSSSPLKLGQALVITTHINQRIQLLIHALITVKLCWGKLPQAVCNSIFKLGYSKCWFAIFLNGRVVTPSRSIKTNLSRLFAGLTILATRWFYASNSYSTTFSLFQHVYITLMCHPYTE